MNSVNLRRLGKKQSESTTARATIPFYSGRQRLVGCWVDRKVLYTNSLNRRCIRAPGIPRKGYDRACMRVSLRGMNCMRVFLFGLLILSQGGLRFYNFTPTRVSWVPFLYILRDIKKICSLLNDR